MGTWEAELGNSLKHGSWPNPFRNMVKRIDVLACEDTFQAMVEMYALGFGNWWWSSFIPSPVEITRKTFTGGYKCGFYGKTKWRSPIDIIWKDGRTSRMLMQISSPITRTLFYIWASETVLDFMSTWSSLQLAMEKCNRNQNETLLRDASAPMQNSIPDGAPVFAEVIYDPKDRATPNDCIIGVDETAFYSAYAFGYFESTSGIYDDCKVGIAVNGEIEWVDVGHVDAYEVKAWSCNVEGTREGFVDLQPRFSEVLTNGLVLKGRFVLTRFTAYISPIPFETPPAKPPIIVPDKPYEFCDAFTPPYI